MSEITDPLKSLRISLYNNGYTNCGDGLRSVIRMINDIESETDQLKKDLSDSDFELNMATSQLMDREKELAECKKDLLKLLPIARVNSEELLDDIQCLHTSTNDDNKWINKYKKELAFIDELTAKYAENIKPELKRVDCDGVGDNDGFFELKVGE